MSLVVTNIPENFRTPDLRNFFSEYIERGAFNCFHFRHRPQTQLKQVLKSSSSPDTTSNPKTGTCNHSSEGNALKWTKNRSDGAEPMQKEKCQLTCNESYPRRTLPPNISGDQNIPNPTTFNSDASETDFDIDKGSEFKERTYGLEGESDYLFEGNSNSQADPSAEKSRAGESTQTLKEKQGSEDVGQDNASESGPARGVSSHWLSSGLSGLTSLISEKKWEAKSNPKMTPKASLSENQVVGETVGSTTKSDARSTKVSECKEHHRSALADSLPSMSKSKRTCCILDIKAEHEESFLRRYDRKHWVCRSGDILPQRCYILKVDFTGHKEEAGTEDYLTRRELSALSLSFGALQDLIEFQPPPLMPQGNIGTPTKHFKALIRTCQLPGAIIKKLGLEFPRGRGKKRFSQMPFDYGTDIQPGQDSKGKEETDIAFTAGGHLIPSSADFTKQRKAAKMRGRRGHPSGPQLELEEEGEDGAEVEEWERYEPFHEDVTSQDRIKERRFEEELEVVWEKGGSGLVFYTDAQYWRAQQGDFDEQTADEWDVDMSVYYEEGAGDKDARDGVDMVHSDKLRSGKITQSAFNPGGQHTGRRAEEEKPSQGKRKKRAIGPALPPAIGRFEAHTRGFGRRMLEAQGWQEGLGLGVGSAGMPYALENDGQHPHDRKGFGYHGEKLQGWGAAASSSKPQPHRHHRISTIFDRPEEADPPTPSLRTSEPTSLTHRSSRHPSTTRPFPWPQ